MAIYQGFVAKLNVKEGRGKSGPWALYSGRIEKDDGSEYDEWLSFGFNKPSCKEGDYVKLNVEKDDKGYSKVTSIEIVKNPPAKAAPEKSAGNTDARKDTYVSASEQRKQNSIHYQSSRKDAIEIVKTLISMDALPITSAKTKAGEAKRYEEIMALVDKLTVRYFVDTETQRILDSVVDEGETHTPTAEAANGTVDETDDA